MDKKSVIRLKYKLIKVFRKAICSVYPEVCPYCLRRIKPLEISCNRCSARFPNINFDRRAHGGFPVSCTFPYIAPYDDAIKRLKFKGYKQFAAQFSVKLSKAVIRSFKDYTFDIITFVPLHPERQRERGFNQSKLLAKELSYIMEIPCERLLVKTKNNPPQHKTDRKHKAENVRNAYKVSDPKAVKNKRILIIDDIITSGHTLGECARTLRAAGADEVFCATLATVVEKTT